MDKQSERPWFILTPEDAEENAAAHMRGFGFTDARVTPPGADGGIDVVASKAIAQVKLERAIIGSEELQRVFGARALQLDKALLFFSFSGYTSPALVYARQVDIELYLYDSDGSIVPRNRSAGIRLRSKRLPFPVPQSLIAEEPHYLLQEDFGRQGAMAQALRLWTEKKANNNFVTRAERIALLLKRAPTELVERNERRLVANGAMRFDNKNALRKTGRQIKQAFSDETPPGCTRMTQLGFIDAPAGGKAYGDL